jgi:Flp pilus assembly protein TadG
MKLVINYRRGGAVVAEAAIVLPLLLLLLCGLMVGGTGVFRYQQVEFQACEAARWASVRGSDYQRQTNQTSPTQQQILQQVVLQYAPNMDPTALFIKVEWINNATNTAMSWDSSPKDVRSITTSGEYITNTVRVTVHYWYSPGLFWDPMIITSVSEAPMSF